MGKKFKVKIIERAYSMGFECYRNALIVERKGKEVFREHDAGEPEDNTFFKDYAWIKDVIEAAYRYGVEDGKDR